MEYKGVVVGEAILGANIFKDIFGAVRDIVGGRAGAYEDEFGKARDIARQALNYFRTILRNFLSPDRHRINFCRRRHCRYD